MKTTIINLFGGPGSGKSTLAADIFHRLKERGLEAELVREYVKDWAWRGIQPTGSADQIYLLAKQIRAEATVLNKVTYLITDSPFLLSPIYERLYNKTNITEQAAIDYYDQLEQKGIVFQNFFLERAGEYQDKGRFQSEKGAKKIDHAIQQFLRDNSILFTTINKRVPLDMRAVFILSQVKKPC